MRGHSLPSWLRAAALSTGKALSFWKMRFFQLPVLSCCGITDQPFQGLGIDPDSEIAALQGGFFVSSAGRPNHSWLR
jgi:hypothetical protein